MENKEDRCVNEKHPPTAEPKKKGGISEVQSVLKQSEVCEAAFPPYLLAQMN